MQLSQLSSIQFAEKTLSNTSNRYKAIDTEQLVTQVLQNIGLNATIDAISMRGKSTKHAVVLTIQTPVLLAGTECFPRIYILNSYAGESSLQIRIGFYRFICSNGMMIGTTHFGRSIRHVQSGIDKLTELQSAIVAAVQYMTTELPAIAESLNRIVLTASQVESILANIGASQRLADKIMPYVQPSTSINILRYVRPEDKQSDGTLSAWNMWNLINEATRQSSRSQLRALDKDARLFDAIQAELSNGTIAA
jgi:hypothetical protein